MLSKNLYAIIFVVCAFLNGTFAKYQFLQSFSVGLRSLPFHGGDFNILNLASFGARKKFNEISKALLVGSSFHYFTHKYREKLPGLPSTFSDVNASSYKKIFKDFCVNLTESLTNSGLESTMDFFSLSSGMDDYQKYSLAGSTLFACANIAQKRLFSLKNISLKSVKSLLSGGAGLFGVGIYNYAADKAIENMKQKMVIGVLNKTGLSASSLKFQMGIYVIEAALKALLSHYINHKVIKKVSDEEDVSLGMLVAEKKPWLLSMLLPWLSKNSQQCVITEATKYMLLCSQAKMIVQNTSATYSPEQKAEAAKYSKSRKSNVFLASHAFHKFLLFGQKSNFSDQKQEFSNQNQNFVKKNDFFSFVQKQKDLLTAIKTFVENIIQKDLDSKQNIQNNSVQVIPRDEPQRSSDSSVKTDESVENIQKPVENNELILFSVQNNQQNLNEHIVNLHSDTVKAIKDYIESEFKDNLLFLHGMNDIKEYSLDRTNYGKLLETIDNHLQDLDFVSKKIQEYNNIHGNFISTGFIKSLLKAGGYNHPRLDEAQEAEEFFNAVKAVEQEKKELSEIQSNKSDA